MRFLDAESGSFLPTAEEARRQEESRADAAEARIAELERLLAVSDGPDGPAANE